LILTWEELRSGANRCKHSSCLKTAGGEETNPYVQLALNKHLWPNHFTDTQLLQLTVHLHFWGWWM